MIRKILSIVIALGLGLTAVAIPLCYDIPMMVNTWWWIYLVVASGLLGFCLVYQDIHISLKFLSIYLFVSSFFSQAPAESFNAYMLYVLTLYFYILAKEADFSIIIKMVEIVFWYQITIATLQYFGLDRLLCFGTTLAFNDQGELVKQTQDKVHHVFYGTVFQSMRLGSLFAIMSPFLLMKNKWYLVPILISAYFLEALGYTFAIGLGVMLYLFLYIRKNKIKEFSVTLLKRFKFSIKVWMLYFLMISFCIMCAELDWPAIRVCIVEGRLPVWWVVLKTWVMDTTGPLVLNAQGNYTQWGPIDWTKVFFGHGMDTFYWLFCYYKHDPNPFPQAHNDWLQIPWEIGLTGFVLVLWFYFKEVWSAFKHNEDDILLGIMIISVNMLFHFPNRMTQTMYLIVTFMALVAQRRKKNEAHKLQSGVEALGYRY